MVSFIILFVNGFNSENLIWLLLSVIIVIIGFVWFFYQKIEKETCLQNATDPDADYFDATDGEDYNSTSFAGAMGHSLKIDSIQTEVSEEKVIVEIEVVEAKEFDANKFPQVVGGLVKDFRIQSFRGDLSADSSKMFLPFSEQKVQNQNLQEQATPEMIAALVHSLVPETIVSAVVEAKMPQKRVRRFCSSFTARVSCEHFDGEGIHNLKTHFWNMSRKENLNPHEEIVYRKTSQILAIHGICMIPG